jgi:hypothetical protein
MALPLASCEYPVITTQPIGATIQGKVPDNSEPLPSQRVYLRREQQDWAWVTKTGSEGEYVFEGVEPGTYEVYVWATKDWTPSSPSCRTSVSGLDSSRWKAGEVIIERVHFRDETNAIVRTEERKEYLPDILSVQVGDRVSYDINCWTGSR